jgi:Predicted membrane protein (DUF2306)
MTAVSESERDRRTDTGADPPRKVSAWRRQYWVGLLAVYCIGFAIYGATRYAEFDPARSRSVIRDDVPFHFPLLAVHVLTGAIALCLCWLQVWPWLRTTHPRIHRRIGYVYFLAGVVPSGLLSLPVAALSTAGQSLRMSLFTLGVLWLSSTVMGFVAIRARRYDDHRRWMLRNVALTTAIITARPIFFVNLYGISWLLPDTYPLDARLTFNESFATGIWGAVIVHLVFVEWFVLKRGRRDRPARRRPEPTTAERRAAV